MIAHDKDEHGSFSDLNSHRKLGLIGVAMCELVDSTFSIALCHGSTNLSHEN